MERTECGVGRGRCGGHERPGARGQRPTRRMRPCRPHQPPPNPTRAHTTTRVLPSRTRGGPSAERSSMGWTDIARAVEPSGPRPDCGTTASLARVPRPNRAVPCCFLRLALYRVRVILKLGRAYAPQPRLPLDPRRIAVITPRAPVTRIESRRPESCHPSCDLDGLLGPAGPGHTAPPKHNTAAPAQQRGGTPHFFQHSRGPNTAESHRVSITGLQMARNGSASLLAGARQGAPPRPVSRQVSPRPRAAPHFFAGHPP